MAATTAILDFRDEDEEPLPLTGSREPTRFGSKGGIIGRPITSREKKQIRQRARRKMKLAEDELRILYGKPIEEWDLEELARGRARASDGTFSGRMPGFIDRAVHEQIVKRFESMVKGEMNQNAVGALKVIDKILNDDSVDDKGKPCTPAGTKLDAAKFLIEHVLGKPKQRVEQDISVRLQAVLGAAMVNPTPDGTYALTQGFIEAQSWEATDDDDDLDD